MRTLKLFLIHARFAILGIALAFLFYFIGAKLGSDAISNFALFVLPMIWALILTILAPGYYFKGMWIILLAIFVIAIFSLLLSLISGLEGWICVVMAAFPLAGAIFVGWAFAAYFLYAANRAIGRAETGLAALIFALLAMDVMPDAQKIYLIETEIFIEAPVEEVFESLHSIQNIQDEEVSTKFVHLLGAPKPREALWVGSGVGAVRTSYWGENIAYFEEHITSYTPNQEISWRFVFPENWIKPGIEDIHIKVGGENFDVRRGGYRLASFENGTRLTLWSETYDGSGLGFYSRFWHQTLFTDFHESILNLVKTRVEAESS